MESLLTYRPTKAGPAPALGGETAEAEVVGPQSVGAARTDSSLLTHSG